MVPAFRHQVQLQRQLSTSSPRCSLHEVIVEEVQRIEMDVSSRQATRTRQFLMAFARFVGRDLPVDRLPADILTRFQRFRIAKAARGTVQKEILTVLRVLRGRLHSVQKPPAIGHGAFHPNRAFTDPELQGIFKAARPLYRDLYMVLLASGARLAEIVPSRRSSHKPLLKSEVDYTAGTVLLRNAKRKPGAREESRLIYVPCETMDALRRVAAETLGPYVFPPLVNPDCEFQACLKRAGIPRQDALGHRLTHHSFRHTFGSKVAQIVRNAFLVKELLGHSRIAMSEHYCHVAAPAIVVDLAFLTKRSTEGSQTGSQGGEQEVKASA